MCDCTPSRHAPPVIFDGIVAKTCCHSLIFLIYMVAKEGTTAQATVCAPRRSLEASTNSTFVVFFSLRINTRTLSHSTLLSKICILVDKKQGHDRRRKEEGPKDHETISDWATSKSAGCVFRHKRPTAATK
jgi:hypothetical protein